MNSQISERASGAEDANAQALRRLHSRRGEPLFVADWSRALFLHYEVDAGALQLEVPFTLDLYEGRAHVSLVAFTMRGLRPRAGGRVGAGLCRPIANHSFLNVRAYVRHRGEPGIVFLNEWLSNRLSVRLGPWPYGLPYRYGDIAYRHLHETGRLEGTVSSTTTSAKLRYQGTLVEGGSFSPCTAGAIDEFLLERYTAFTCRAGRRRFFRIWHPPWRRSPAGVNVVEDNLIAERWGWFRQAKFIGADYSPGVRGVQMGWPHRLSCSLARRTPRGLRTNFEWP